MDVQPHLTAALKDVPLSTPLSFIFYAYLFTPRLTPFFLPLSPAGETESDQRRQRENEREREDRRVEVGRDDPRPVSR